MTDSIAENIEVAEGGRKWSSRCKLNTGSGPQRPEGSKGRKWGTGSEAPAVESESLHKGRTLGAGGFHRHNLELTFRNFIYLDVTVIASASTPSSSATNHGYPRKIKRSPNPIRPVVEGRGRSHIRRRRSAGE
jgi:hypothetical protein